MSSIKQRLYDALNILHPRDFANVPLEDLDNFLKEAFAAAEVMVNSVPYSNTPANGSALSSIQLNTEPSKATDLPSQPIQPPSVAPQHEELKSIWGKPMNLGASVNPLNVALYKLSPNDRRGAWFARRSIHYGMSFSKWKKAMKSEFAESISVSGGPGAGAIRGLGADLRLEKKDAKGIGKLEVYLFSAQFPGPTSPRDFVTLLLSSDEGLSDASSPHQDENKSGDQIPRHYILVSIPVHHDGAPIRNGYVRGQYESVEMIREIPASYAKIKIDEIKSTPNLSSSINEQYPVAATNTSATSTTSLQSSPEKLISGSSEDGKLVEWIMITRSDPGGGIPRFMVERGTPSSIAGDAVKFLDWAASKEEFLEEYNADLAIVESGNDKADGDVEKVPLDRRISDRNTFEPSGEKDTGIISSLTNAIGQYLPDSLQLGSGSENDDIGDMSSDVSFVSAEDAATDIENEKLSLSSAVVDDKSTSGSSEKTSLEKKLAKIEEQRAKLEANHQKALATAEKKAKTATVQNNNDNEATKIKEKIDKQNQKREEKHARELEKLEIKRVNEIQRAEDRRRKAEDSDALNQIRKERDQSRRMTEVLRKESEILRQRIAEIQRENTLLLARIDLLDDGKAILKDVRDELKSSS